MTKKLHRPGKPDMVDAPRQPDVRTENSETSTATAQQTPAVALPLPLQRRPPTDRPAWPTSPASRVGGLPKPEPPISLNGSSATDGESAAATESANDETPASRMPPAAMPLPGVFPGFSPTSNGNGMTMPPVSETTAVRSVEQTLEASNGVGLASPVELRATRPLPAEPAPVSHEFSDLNARFSELLAAQRRLTQSLRWLGFGVFLCLLLSAGALYRSWNLEPNVSPVEASAPMPRSHVAAQPSPSLPVKKAVAPKPVVASSVSHPAASHPVINSVMAGAGSSGKPSAENDETNFVVNANALGADITPSPPPKKR